MRSWREAEKIVKRKLKEEGWFVCRIKLERISFVNGRKVLVPRFNPKLKENLVQGLGEELGTKLYDTLYQIYKPLPDFVCIKGDKTKLVEVTTKKLIAPSSKKQYGVMKRIWEELKISEEIIRVIFNLDNTYNLESYWKIE